MLADHEVMIAALRDRDNVTDDGGRRLASGRAGAAISTGISSSARARPRLMPAALLWPGRCRVQRIGRVQFAIEIGKLGLGVVKMTHICVSAGYSAPRWSSSSPSDVPARWGRGPSSRRNLMEDVAEEMPVLKLVLDQVVDLRRQGLDPVAVVAAQRDVQRQNILDPRGRGWRDSGSRRPRRRNGAEGGPSSAVHSNGIAPGRGEHPPGTALRLGDAAPPMRAKAGGVIAVAKSSIRFGQVRHQPRDALRDPVRNGIAQTEPLRSGIDAGLGRKQRRHPVGAQLLDEQERVPP